MAGRPGTDGDSEALVRRFAGARRDPALAVLEGFHALKHALRFGACVTEIVSREVLALARLADEFAPDQSWEIRRRAEEVEPSVFAAIAPNNTPTGVIAIAARSSVDVGVVLAASAPHPVVLLENPRDLANVGACVRVCAAADVAGLLTTGQSDPWHPNALRGAAGLHYACPVARVDSLPAGDRPLIAIDPEGDPLDAGALPARSLLVFGTERHGVSDDLLARAHARMRIPMRPGVSSLNLATAVSVVLFAQRLCAGSPPPEAADGSRP